MLTHDLVHSVHAHGVDPQAREVFVFPEDGYPATGSGSKAAARLLRNLRFMDNDGDGPVLVHLKSCPSEMDEALAMYEAVRFCPFPVTVLAYGRLRPEACFLLQAAKYRVLTPLATAVLYEPQAGDADRRESLAEAYMLGVMRSPSGTVAGKTEAEVRERMLARMAEGAWRLRAPEAVRELLADAVFDGKWDAMKRGRED